MTIEWTCDIFQQLGLMSRLNALTIQPKPTTKRSKSKYWDIMCAFDIETSRIPNTEQSIMYSWQFAFDDDCYLGRTWNEFQSFLKFLRTRSEATFVIYVSSLSYEFQYLRGIIPIDNKRFVSVDNRKVVRFCSGNLEFRDSVSLTGRGLGKFLKDMGVKNQKTELEYRLFRDSSTLLKPKEIEYCVNDVVGLTQALRKYIYQVLKRDLYTITLTSTGLVREDMKKALIDGGFYEKPHTVKGIHYGGLYPIWREDSDTMRLLLTAFRGGNTHGNRYFCGKILDNVKSADRSSSYPDVMINRPYPLGEWRYYSKWSKRLPTDKPWVAKMTLSDLELKEFADPMPYLSIHKCLSVSDYIPDNGRILSAESVTISITDIDYKIINDHYCYSSVTVHEISVNSCYADLPECAKAVVIDYYIRKTALKDVEDRKDDYSLLKALLNSLYGMCAQNRMRGHPTYKDGEWIESEQPTIDDYYRDAFLPYSVGVWVTAWARLALEEGIKLAGNNFVYADTDSVKYIGDVDFSAFNKKCVCDCKRTGAFAKDINGKTHYMGVFEEEHPYDRFVQMGAKKYAFEIDGSLGITIAGVSKKEGVKELGCLENFKKGFVFTTESAGLRSVYNDGTTEETYNGKTYTVTPNICLIPVNYTISISDGIVQFYESNQTCVVELDTLL